MKHFMKGPENHKQIIGSVNFAATKLSSWSAFFPCTKFVFLTMFQKYASCNVERKGGQLELLGYVHFWKISIFKTPTRLVLYIERTIQYQNIPIKILYRTVSAHIAHSRPNSFLKPSSSNTARSNTYIARIVLSANITPTTTKTSGDHSTRHSRMSDPCVNKHSKKPTKLMRYPVWMGWRTYAYGPLLTSLCSLRTSVENRPSSRIDQIERKAPEYVEMQPKKKERENFRPIGLSLLNPYSCCATITPHSAKHRHV
jgi:hypothetical protein